MEEKGAETGRQKGYSRIKTDEQRDQDRGPESHEHELNAYYRTLQWGKSLC